MKHLRRYFPHIDYRIAIILGENHHAAIKPEELWRLKKINTCVFRVSPSPADFSASMPTEFLEKSPLVADRYTTGEFLTFWTPKSTPSKLLKTVFLSFSKHSKIWLFSGLRPISDRYTTRGKFSKGEGEIFKEFSWCNFAIFAHKTHLGEANAKILLDFEWYSFSFP